SDPRVREDQQVPRQPAAVLLREAEEDARRRRHAARQRADPLRLADGEPERPQPQALSAVLRRPRWWPVEGSRAHQGQRRHADGERDARRAAAGGGRGRQLWRQHWRRRSQYGPIMMKQLLIAFGLAASIGLGAAPPDSTSPVADAAMRKDGAAVR